MLDLLRKSHEVHRKHPTLSKLCDGAGNKCCQTLVGQDHLLPAIPSHKLREQYNIYDTGSEAC